MHFHPSPSRSLRYLIHPSVFVACVFNEVYDSSWLFSFTPLAWFSSHFTIFSSVMSSSFLVFCSSRSRFHPLLHSVLLLVRSHIYFSRFLHWLRPSLSVSPPPQYLAPPVVVHFLLLLCVLFRRVCECHICVWIRFLPLFRVLLLFFPLVRVLRLFLYSFGVFRLIACVFLSLFTSYFLEKTAISSSSFWSLCSVSCSASWCSLLGIIFRRRLLVGFRFLGFRFIVSICRGSHILWRNEGVRRKHPNTDNASKFSLCDFVSLVFLWGITLVGFCTFWFDPSRLKPKLKCFAQFLAFFIFQSIIPLLIQKPIFIWDSFCKTLFFLNAFFFLIIL